MDHEIELKKEGIVSLVENHELDNIIKPLVRDIHLFDSYIAGTTHLPDRSVLEDIKIGDELTLQREDNRFDSNAILILDAQKRKLGYVPEKDNIIFARLMDAGKLLKAQITKIEKKGNYTRISVGIYLVDF
ncbi:MAG: HIRAN domain-containing protein [Eubacteriaceae bacterium]|nr:HIRAN domain-containing protein [Eubacteriaceae bacterium]